MLRNIDEDFMTLFGPAGLEALVKVLLVEISVLQKKAGLLEVDYNTFVSNVLKENAEIIIPKEK